MATEVEQPTRFIEKSELINAPASKVFDAITKPELIQQWVSGFMAGARVEGNWEKGGQIVTKIGEGACAKGVVTENVPNKLIKAQFYNRIPKGQNPLDCDFSAELGEYTETFELEEQDGKTLLKSRAGPVKEAEFERLDPLWGKSIPLIKGASEKAN